MLYILLSSVLKLSQMFPTTMLLCCLSMTSQLLCYAFY